MCLLDSNATFPTVVFGEAFLVYFTKDSNCLRLFVTVLLLCYNQIDILFCYLEMESEG